MYVVGVVIPVPGDKKDAYRAWSENSAALFKEFGCLEIVESWEDHVPDGKQTDMRRAVAAQPGEKIVFSWQVWPDKQTLDAAEEKMRDDRRFDIPVDMPFDAKRLIYGCFSPLHVMGRD
ncbi:DUF1428 domain-containing protein [Nitrospirillum sp. BR 11164]|uniref:DUF1428 domain-containing protein n=1 Tax=Nitrospirillum sp. BR 11164 TaxID=3104324 RepID=UPI002AFF8C88|nr:DUF1428 domain-containing protein [Nitrospirillum sp. BR 11164]MEA1650590.1 DUF1428 domain-containing protein [Nitrospirillum sp. BR 11164]